MSELVRVWPTFVLLLTCGQAAGEPVPSADRSVDSKPAGRFVLDERVLAGWRPREHPGMLGPKIDVKSLDTSKWAVKDSAAAMAKAECVLGIARGAHPTDAELIAVLDDDTPFLTQYLLERPMWQVVVRDWTLQLPSADAESRDPYVRTFDVLVRPEDGRVVRVRSRWPQEEPAMPPEPSAQSATCQIYASNYTVYHGFPDSDPGVTFSAALDALYKRGLDILTAKQLSARYVLWSEFNFQHRELRPVWAVTVRGAHPVLPRPEMAIERKYEYRAIVDANSGRFLAASNSPQPDQAIQNERGEDGR